MEEMILKQQKAENCRGRKRKRQPFQYKNDDDNNKDKEEHERTIQAMKDEANLEKDALQAKITELEASVKS